MGDKAKRQGLLLFQMSIAYHLITKEKFTEIMTCMQCYMTEDHLTSCCPKPKEHEVCSECASHEHTWKSCPAEKQKCLNCGEGHITLAMKSPKRKEAISNKETANNTSNKTYSTTTKTNTQHATHFNMTLPDDSMKKSFICLLHAHMMMYSPAASKRTTFQTWSWLTTPHQNR